MVASPEVARMIMDFEDCELGAHSGDSNDCHHEQFPGVQSTFMKDVRSLTAVFEEMGNPFLEESQDLMVFDTRDIMNSSIGETVRNAETIGEKQYSKFVEERLQAAKPLTDILPKNNLALFSRPSVKCSPSKQKNASSSIKEQLQSLFTAVCIMPNKRW